jgi:hypothetical protein
MSAPSSAAQESPKRWSGVVRAITCVNSLLVLLLAGALFIYPPVRAFLDIRDPALQKPGIPKAAWRLYQNLTPRYADWAQKRVAAGRAENLSTADISGTEWPLFGSVFFLWAVDDLQTAWDGGDHSAGVEPKVFAKDAIIAASELVVDPGHASWVKKHWGGDYLHRENVFYRMLVIAALSTREKLLHDGAHMELLRDQVETFAKELDASNSGLLDDYPGECYPGDVMAMLMCIKRADGVLGTDHSGFLNRALRGFTGRNAARVQLPPYSAISATGRPTSEARGCANSYICLTSPELWPGQAKRWYALYDKFFWQERMAAAGFREYPNDVTNADWTMDVDAGPVVDGYGVSACAFGIGAARKNGRFDRAYPLSAEMLATVMELPNGMLGLPRLLSNFSDAPMLGEAGILWQLTVQPQKGFAVKSGGGIPNYVWIVLAGMLLLGVWRILTAIGMIERALREPGFDAWLPGFQVVLWCCLAIGTAAAFYIGWGVSGFVLLVLAAALPMVKRKKLQKQVDEWPEAYPQKPADKKV